MLHAFAPRMPRGFSWIWLAIAAIALVLVAPRAIAQNPAKPKAEEPSARADAPEADSSAFEVIHDPNGKKALAKIEPLTFVGSPIKIGPGSADLSLIQNMAVEATAIDVKFLTRYVEFFAVELSKRDNINAIINPTTPGQANALRGLEKAVEALTDPIVRARANDKRSFLSAYSKVLFDSSLVKLLDNNLFSRLDAMIVLGTAGSTDPKALDLYIAQIKKPDQIFQVKMWAARGLTNATRQGRDNLESSKTIDAAEALIGLLDSDPKLPWPLQMRALEALGSLRMPYNKVRRVVDAASVVMRFLADRDARPEVRAWAAWALGMMRVPSQVSPYNFELIANQIGDLAADLGRRIVEEFDDNADDFEKHKDRATTLTGLLIFEVFPAISGTEGITESGLLRSSHPGLGVAKPFVMKVEAKVKDVAREAYELLRAGGTAQKTKRNDLDARIADLKGVLSQSNPKDRHVVPNGPEFAPANAQVAGAARRP